MSRKGLVWGFERRIRLSMRNVTGSDRAGLTSLSVAASPTYRYDSAFVPVAPEALMRMRGIFIATRYTTLSPEQDHLSSVQKTFFDRRPHLLRGRTKAHKKP